MALKILDRTSLIDWIKDGKLIFEIANPRQNQTMALNLSSKLLLHNNLPSKPQSRTIIRHISSSKLTTDLLPPSERNASKMPPKEQLAFGRTFSDHMLKIEYVSGRGWGDPMIGRMEDLKISPAASSLHYGQCCFCFVQIDMFICNTAICKYLQQDLVLTTWSLCIFFLAINL
jgi:hypothetical protein